MTTVTARSLSRLKKEPEAKTANTVESRLEEVTPEMATAWLEANKRNRGIQDLRVRRYAEDMKNGDWHITGEAIKFDTNNDVLDGQHRLWAIQEAQVPIWTFVTTGLEPEAQDFMDTGKTRTFGDVLQIRGVKDPNLVAGVASLIYAWENGRFSDFTLPRNLSHAVTDKVFHEHEHEIISAVEFPATRKMVPGLTAGVRGFSLWKLRTIDREQADQFLTDLVNFNTSGQGDPKAALLRRLATAKASRITIDRYTQVKLLFKVWNMTRRGESADRLQIWRSGEAFPAVEPI